MEMIPLTKCQFTIVDDEDYEWLSQWQWYAEWREDQKTWYAARTERDIAGVERTIKMHRQILGLEYGDKRQGDHIYHMTLDNRRSQLRITTPRQNCLNRRIVKASHKEKLYYYHADLGKYRARYFTGKRYVHIGLFDTYEQAKQAWIVSDYEYHANNTSKLTKGVK